MKDYSCYFELKAVDFKNENEKNCFARMFFPNNNRRRSDYLKKNSIGKFPPRFDVSSAYEVPGTKSNEVYIRGEIGGGKFGERKNGLAITMKNPSFENELTNYGKRLETLIDYVSNYFPSDIQTLAAAKWFDSPQIRFESDRLKLLSNTEPVLWTAYDLYQMCVDFSAVLLWYGWNCVPSKNHTDNAGGMRELFSRLAISQVFDDVFALGRMEPVLHLYTAIEKVAANMGVEVEFFSTMVGNGAITIQHFFVTSEGALFYKTGPCLTFVLEDSYGDFLKENPTIKDVDPDYNEEKYRADMADGNGILYYNAYCDRFDCTKYNWRK